MEEFVAYIIKNLVSKPEAVQVASIEGTEPLKIEIRVAPEDVGKMIGRKGNTINALRTIVRTVATRLGQQVQVELIQPEREQEKAPEKELIAPPTETVATEEAAPTEEAVAEEPQEAEVVAEAQEEATVEA